MAVIFHIDINSFFATCELKKNKELKDLPVVVSRKDVFLKSIILSPSYKAREYGIKTTMSLREAYRICKELVVCEPDYVYYKKVSEEFFDYLYSVSPLLEPMSIDEGYLDVTELKDTNYLELAKTIQNTLLNKYGLPVSIGIAPNKFLAKMASDYKKPLGITVFRKRDIKDNLWKLPIKAMIGVGKKTEPLLKNLGILTIGDLASFPDFPKLEEVLGEKTALALYSHAHGEGESTLSQNDDTVKSISRMHTYQTGVFSEEVILSTLKVLLKDIVYELETKSLGVRTIGVSFKFNNFKSMSRSKNPKEVTSDYYELYSLVDDIFNEVFALGDEVRAIGVFCSRIVDFKVKNRQISLFEDQEALEKENKVKKVIAKINENYDLEIINLGVKNARKK